MSNLYTYLWKKITKLAICLWWVPFRVIAEFEKQKIFFSNSLSVVSLSSLTWWLQCAQTYLMCTFRHSMFVYVCMCKLPFKVLRHFTQWASMTCINMHARRSKYTKRRLANECQQQITICAFVITLCHHVFEPKGTCWIFRLHPI